MKCPYCGSESTKIVRSKAGSSEFEMQKTRKCNNCAKTFSTIEVLNQDKSIDTSPTTASPDEVLAAIHKKLNVIARTLVSMETTQSKGLQPKNKLAKKSISAQEAKQSCRNYFGSDFDDFEDMPDPHDIEAWAKLLASMD